MSECWKHHFKGLNLRRNKRTFIAVTLTLIKSMLKNGKVFEKQ